MAYASYVARRALAPGHASGSPYGLPMSLTDVQAPSAGTLRTVTKTLSGAVETLFFGEERIWSLTLAPVRRRDAALLYEFLRSTADGQVFAFDPYGTEGQNVQRMNVVREDAGYTETPFARDGRGGLTDWVTLAFQVREV